MLALRSAMNQASLALLFMALCTPTALAIQVASFSLEGCAWGATHIAVVTEGKRIDGILQVLESWKGGLKKGEVLTIPELAQFAPESQRVISRGPKTFGRLYEVYRTPRYSRNRRGVGHVKATPTKWTGLQARLAGALCMLPCVGLDLLLLDSGPNFWDWLLHGYRPLH
jgi:hypothetical protein